MQRPRGTLANPPQLSDKPQQGERHGTRNFVMATRCADPHHHYSFAHIPSLISTRHHPNAAVHKDQREATGSSTSVLVLTTRSYTDTCTTG
jgi:hypothetical protein